MESDFELDAIDRAKTSDELADIPSLTIAWHALKSLYRDFRFREQKQFKENEKLADVLVDCVNYIHTLKQLIPEEHGLNTNAYEQHVGQVVEAILSRVNKVGIHVIAPKGEPYTAELREQLGNEVQIPDPEVDCAYVDEVLVPTIIFGAEIKQMGKAVIRIPDGSYQPQKRDHKDHTDLYEIDE